MAFLSAAGGAAVLADQAALLVDQGFASADGALLALDGGAVLNVFLEGAFHTVLPVVDILRSKVQRADELDAEVNWHLVTEYA